MGGTSAATPTPCGDVHPLASLLLDVACLSPGLWLGPTSLEATAAASICATTAPSAGGGAVILRQGEAQGLASIRVSISAGWRSGTLASVGFRPSSRSWSAPGGPNGTGEGRNSSAPDRKDEL